MPHFELKAARSWLSRLSKFGPRLVSLILVMLIVGECWQATLRLLNDRPDAELSSPAFETFPRPNQQPPPFELRPIVSARLFGSIPDDVTLEQNQASFERENIRLLGTIASEDRTHGLAIISIADVTNVFAVGDEIKDASLQFVYLDRVVLNRRGNFGTLTFPVLASHDFRKRLLVDPEEDASSFGRLPRNLGEAVRARASFDGVSGNVLGFLIEPNQLRRAFYDLGLYPEDLVTAVNGTTLIGQDHAQAIIDEMLAASQAVITVVRIHGEPRDISVDISSWEPPMPSATLANDIRH